MYNYDEENTRSVISAKLEDATPKGERGGNMFVLSLKKFLYDKEYIVIKYSDTDSGLKIRSTKFVDEPTDSQMNDDDTLVMLVEEALSMAEDLHYGEGIGQWQSFRFVS